MSWFSQPELSRTSIFTFFLRIHLHSQNLTEAYSWMRGKKQTQNQNLPEAYTWMRYNKKEGKPCGVLPFFLTSFSQPGPAVPEPYTSSRPLKQENITPEWMRYNKKRGKPCGVLTVFCPLVFTARTFQNINFKLFLRIHLHSQNLPEAYSWMRRKKQTQSQNLPEAYTRMRYSKKKKTMWRFTFFFWLHFHSQDLPRRNHTPQAGR